MNDLHYGVSGNDGPVPEELDKFIQSFLIDVDEEKPDAIIIAGDFLHDRKKIDVKTIDRASLFLQELESREIPTFILLGNHDIYYRNTLSPNSLEPLCQKYQYVKAVTKPTFLKVLEKECLMIPWICKDNEEEVNQSIDETQAEYLFAHLELKGFELMPGIISTHGDDVGKYTKFTKVFTGHYHARQNKNNILYMGTQYHMNRADNNITKGYHRLEDNGDITFVPNHSKLFMKLEYDDDTLQHIIESDDSFKGKIATINCADCDDNQIKSLAEVLENSSLHDFKILTSKEKVKIDVSSDSTSARPVIDIVHDFVKLNPKEGLSEAALIKMMTDAYDESLQVE